MYPQQARTRILGRRFQLHGRLCSTLSIASKLEIPLNSGRGYTAPRVLSPERFRHQEPLTTIASRLRIMAAGEPVAKRTKKVGPFLHSITEHHEAVRPSTVLA